MQRHRQTMGTRLCWRTRHPSSAEVPALRLLGFAGKIGFRLILGLVLILPGFALAADATTQPKATPVKARICLVTGIDYPGHLWRQTAPVLADALRKEERLEVFTVEDPHFLDSTALARYDAVILHWQNWQEPGPNQAARDNLRRFVEGGKGVVLVHFACGAWHGEWPEFTQVAGRIWAGPGPGVRQHDPYGTFRVEIAKPDHPITRGLTDFDTQDEL